MPHRCLLWKMYPHMRAVLQLKVVNLWVQWCYIVLVYTCSIGHIRGALVGKHLTRNVCFACAVLLEDFICFALQQSNLLPSVLYYGMAMEPSLKVWSWWMMEEGEDGKVVKTWHSSKLFQLDMFSQQSFLLWRNESKTPLIRGKCQEQFESPTVLVGFFCVTWRF